jgi:NAD(P)-dependent dehydrogenase (short-subunit alcohol dehydrogenase family)
MTMSPVGCEQQIKTLPSAGGSTGSGRLAIVPPMSPVSQLWQTPARHDQRTGTSQASASSSTLCLTESQRTLSPLRANDTSGPVPAGRGLVNSAGIRGVGNILDTDPEVWRKVLSVNLEGTFNMCQAFARAVRQAQTQAAIVNLSSAAGIRGVPNRLPYAASKYGVVGITQTMALELGPLGVRVNAVVPGMIRTPMTAPMFEDPENVKRIRAAHPIGREGQPEEVAAAIAFLLSDDASFITAWLFRLTSRRAACWPPSSTTIRCRLDKRSRRNIGQSALGGRTCSPQVAGRGCVTITRIPLA